MFTLWVTLELAIILALIYYYITKRYSYWSSRGVPGPRPLFPFGYLWDRSRSTPEQLELGYTAKYGKVYGLYSGLVPTLTITDAELIKTVLVRDFPTYFNRRHLNPLHDIWNLNMFNGEDATWKRMRSITTPAFTSGKLRAMYGLMGACIDQLDGYLEKRTAEVGGDGRINTKEVMSGFTIDVIAQAAFATLTNANSVSRDNNPNTFVWHGMNLFRFNPFKLMACLALPRPVLQALRIDSFFPTDSLKFFIDLTSQIVEQRKSGTVKNADLVQLLVDSFAFEEDLVKENYDSLAASMEEDVSPNHQTSTNGTTIKTKKQMTTKEIIAQCILFLIAGFETTATTLTHALFEMASNPQIQQRLVDELTEQLADLDQTEDKEKYYDVIINNCPYLDALVKETLRKYPPVIRLERRVVAENTKLGGIPLEKDVLIEISTLAVHRDPEYYPEPERFNPERFMPEYKNLLTPYTYLPFGQGPRNCVGMRFAYQEIKLCLGTILAKYHFSRTFKTPEKLTFLKGQLMMNCVPFELSVERRE